MKKLDILFNTSIRQVQGINYVNNSFVVGQTYFNQNDILLNKIYSPDGIFCCTEHNSLDTIGSDVNTGAYKRKRKFRTILREFFSSKYLLGCLIKILFNIIIPAKRALCFYFDDEPKSDYIIFQDTFTAYFYFKSPKRNKNVKTVLILHCSEDPIEQGIPMFPGFFKYKKLETLFRGTVEFAMKSCDKVVYLSEGATKTSVLDDNHKTFVFNGIEDINNYKFENVHTPLNFVIVASVIDHKGQHILIDALSYIDFKYRKMIILNIVGNGTNLDYCRKLAINKGVNDNVVFWGNRNDVAEILKKMDVFILPSISEGMPMSMIEAMRQGLYIMATFVGGMREMIQPDFGEYIERDPHKIADSITRLLEKQLVTEISKKKAREHFLKNFTLQKMIDSYSKILLSL